MSDRLLGWISWEILERIWRNSGRKRSRSNPWWISWVIPGWASGEILGEIPGRTPGGSSTEIPGEIPGRILRRIFGEIPGGAPGWFSKHTGWNLKSISEGTLERILGGIHTGWNIKSISEGFLERILGGIPGGILMGMPWGFLEEILWGRDCDIVYIVTTMVEFWFSASNRLSFSTSRMTPWFGIPEQEVRSAILEESL